MIHDYIDSLGDALMLSTPNDNSGCWHIEVDKAERRENVFTSYHDLYQFNKKLLALKKDPTTNQHVVGIVHSGVE